MTKWQNKDDRSGFGLAFNPSLRRGKRGRKRDEISEGYAPRSPFRFARICEKMVSKGLSVTIGLYTVVYVCGAALRWPLACAEGLIFSKSVVIKTEGSFRWDVSCRSTNGCAFAERKATLPW